MIYRVLRAVRQGHSRSQAVRHLRPLRLSRRVSGGGFGSAPASFRCVWSPCSQCAARRRRPDRTCFEAQKRAEPSARPWRRQETRNASSKSSWDAAAYRHGCVSAISMDFGHEEPQRNVALVTPCPAKANPERSAIGPRVIIRHETVAVFVTEALGGQALAALGAAPRDDLPAVLGGHAGPETVTASTHEAARLESTLHDLSPRKPRPLAVECVLRICPGDTPTCAPEYVSGAQISKSREIPH